VRRVQQTIFGSFPTTAPCDRCQGHGTIVNTPCPECRGQGKVRSVRRLAVKIPPGVDANTQIRLVGEGEPGTKGGPPCNLYVVLKVRKHRHFRRDGNDVLYDLTINFAQAALGDEVTVPTVDGEVKLAIPPATQYGAVLTIKGKGVPYLHSNDRRGDQRVQVKIATPTRLNKEQKQLLHELARSLGKGKDVTPPNDKGVFDKMRDALGV
jgi:molecular chaperone DnaJ